MIASAARVDVDLRSRAGAGGPAAGEDVADSSSPTVAATSGRGSTAPAAYCSIVPASRARRPGRPTAVTSLSTSVRVSIRLGSRPGRCRRPACPARPGRGPAPAARRRWTRRSPRPTRSAGRSARGPDAGEAERAGEARDRSGVARAGAPRRPRPGRTRPTSRPIVPGPRTSSAVPPAARRPRGPRAARCRPARPARRQRRRPRPAAPCSARTGTASCSASAPGQPPRMPISNRSAQTLCRPRRQRSQCPQPSIVSPVTRRPSQAASTPSPTRRHDAAPLVPEPQRVAGVSLVQVGHLAGEELDVGAAHARRGATSTTTSPGFGDRSGDVLHGTLARAGHDERPHRADRPSRASARPATPDVGE